MHDIVAFVQFRACWQHFLCLTLQCKMMWFFLHPQRNPVPHRENEDYSFRLHEDADRYQWTPRLTAFEFQRLLSNITAIKIRGAYNPGGKYINEPGTECGLDMAFFKALPESFARQMDQMTPLKRFWMKDGKVSGTFHRTLHSWSQTLKLYSGQGFLDNMELGTARQGNSGAEEAPHVEQCECPEGYVGQFCESCAPGYHRDPPNSGPIARCIPCNCNGHSDICDVDTGKVALAWDQFLNTCEWNYEHSQVSASASEFLKKVASGFAQIWECSSGFASARRWSFHSQVQKLRRVTCDHSQVKCLRNWLLVSSISSTL